MNKPSYGKFSVLSPSKLKTLDVFCNTIKVNYCMYKMGTVIYHTKILRNHINESQIVILLMYHPIFTIYMLTYIQDGDKSRYVT